MCQDLSGNVRKCQDGKKVQRVKRVPEGKRFGNPSMEREGRQEGQVCHEGLVNQSTKFNYCDLITSERSETKKEVC